MKNIIDRLGDIMTHYALKKYDLSKKLELSPTAVTNIFQNKSLPSYTTLKKVLEIFPEVSPDWLLLGYGSMMRTTPERYAILPVVGNISAGTPLGISDVEPLQYVPVDIHTLGPPDRLTCFQVYGDSMAPLIVHNDLIIITSDYDPDQLNHKIAAVQIDGENTLKVVLINADTRQFILLPINCLNFKPIVMSADSPQNIKILGLVVLQIRTH